MNVSGDIGFAYSQFLANNKEVIFQSAGGEINRSDFDALGSQENFDIQTSEGSWTFEKDTTGTRRQNDDWVFSSMYLGAVLLGISETISLNTRQVDINLTTGLPHKNWEVTEFKEQFRKRLTGSHTINRQTKQTIDIKNVNIVPQSLGTIFYHFLDNQGHFRNIDKKEFIIGSVNIGGHTVELSTVRFEKRQDGDFSFNLINKQCGSEPLGMYSTLSKLKKLLREVFPNEVWRDHELFDILRLDNLTLFGKDYNVKEITQNVRTSYQDEITGLITTNWSDQSEIRLSKLDGLINAGGGALAMNCSELKEYHPNILMSNAPQWDTVAGYEKLAKLLERDKK